MVRIVHIFDVKPGVDEKSFIQWVDGTLREVTLKFGCRERSTWIYLDGIEGTYEKGKPIKRPKYINEAFWPSQKEADEFRRWLLSEDGRGFRTRLFDSITNHVILRYTDYAPPAWVGDD
jgi:hypothetical protein